MYLLRVYQEFLEMKHNTTVIKNIQIKIYQN